MTEHPVICCEHLSKSFGERDQSVRILKKIHLTVSAGQMIAILGTSGSGKSTLLHLMGGLDVPTDGKVWVEGKDLSLLNEKEKGCLRNRCLGFVYQFHHLLPEFSVLENVAIPLLIRKMKPRLAVDQARAVIRHVALSHRMTHGIAELSGGERQRVAIARALVTQPRCVLADEPTGNLDYKTAERVIDLMCELNEVMKTSFVIVTHSERLAAKVHRVFLLENGHLYEKS